MSMEFSYHMISQKLKPAMIMIILFSIIISRVGLALFFAPLPNFSPIHALALFCGAYFGRQWLSCIMVLFVVWASDVLMSPLLMGQWTFFYPACEWQYGAYIVMTLLGSLLHNRIRPNVLLMVSLLSSVLFFVISNFGVWLSGLLYPITQEGLITCYLAAIPFYKNSLLSDLFFSAVIFSAYGWIKHKEVGKAGKLFRFV
jgi:hypothetical protein